MQFHISISLAIPTNLTYAILGKPLHLHLSTTLTEKRSSEAAFPATVLQILQLAYGTTGIAISISSLIQKLSQDIAMIEKSWPFVHKQQRVIKKNQIQKPKDINLLHS